MSGNTLEQLCQLPKKELPSPKLEIIWSAIQTEASDMNPVVKYSYAKYLHEIQRKQLDTCELQIASSTAHWTSPSAPALRRMFVSRKRCFASNSFATEIGPGPHEKLAKTKNPWTFNNIQLHSAPARWTAEKASTIKLDLWFLGFYTSVLQPGFHESQGPQAQSSLLPAGVSSPWFIYPSSCFFFSAAAWISACWKTTQPLRSNLLSEMQAALSVCSMRNDACLPVFLHKPSLVGLQCQAVEHSIKLCWKQETVAGPLEVLVELLCESSSQKTLWRFEVGISSLLFA